MTALVDGFDLGGSAVSGTIPTEIGGLANLVQDFSLASTSMSGVIPTQL